MRNDKNKALKLRLQGKSYNEITKTLGVPKSTLSEWFTNLVLSKEASERLKTRAYHGSVTALVKRNKLQTHLAKQRAFSVRNNALKEIGQISKRDLFILGIGLYWAEGYKRPIIKNGVERSYHPVSLSNSDPKLVMVFLKFLREICKIDESKITAGLRIYQHHNPEYLLNFWSELTKIPKGKFQKFYYGISKSSLGKRPFNVLPYGTIQIRIANTELYHNIMGWIDGLAKMV
jgi:hypothetical protein